jgi:hypothetical protein
MIKNIFILPTTNQSKIAIYNNILRLGKQNWDCEENEIIPQNIYITSNEKIKRNDYVFYLENNSIGKVNSLESELNEEGGYFKKIILTTNKDLIADGVQSIDDDFLEWFCKNPSCEEIEVEITDRNNNGYGIPFGGIFYKIIIPKKEPKSYLNKSIFKNVSRLINLREEPKQETLEEAAENHLQKWRQLSNIHLSNVLHAERCKNDFIAGAKWQQEKMHSYDELRKIAYNAFCLGQTDNPTENMYNGWIEQFKKK